MLCILLLLLFIVPSLQKCLVKKSVNQLIKIKGPTSGINCIITILSGVDVIEEFLTFSNTPVKVSWQ